MSENHRADAIFALPRLPTTATIGDAGPEWREGLIARGVEIVDHAGQLWVGGDAPRYPADSVIFDRSSSRASRDLHTERLIPLPPTGSPAFFFSSRHPRPMSYALGSVIPVPPGRRGLRNRVVAAGAGIGLLPPVPRGLTLGARSAGPPALIAAARELGVEADPGWFMTVAPGAITRRCTMLLFPARARRPSLALKFARAPGVHVQFERDERGLGLAAAAGGTVAAHAPRWLGRCDLNGRAASLETAAAGVPLTNLIGRTRDRSGRLDAVEIGAEWILQVGRRTATRSARLAGEFARLRNHVLPRWQGTAPLALLDAVQAVPAVLHHGDIYEDHIVVQEDDFTVLDWEYAIEHAFPLWDLAFYAVNVLAAVDSAGDRQQKDRYAIELFLGRAPSSSILFRWVREHVNALGLEPAAVGALITLYWLHRSELSRTERERAERVLGHDVQPSWLERTADLWLAEPSLRQGWDAWIERA